MFCAHEATRHMYAFHIWISALNVSWKSIIPLAHQTKRCEMRWHKLISKDNHFEFCMPRRIIVFIAKRFCGQKKICSGVERLVEGLCQRYWCRQSSQIGSFLRKHKQQLTYDKKKNSFLRIRSIFTIARQVTFSQSIKMHQFKTFRSAIIKPFRHKNLWYFVKNLSIVFKIVGNFVIFHVKRSHGNSQALKTHDGNWKVDKHIDFFFLYRLNDAHKINKAFEVEKKTNQAKWKCIQSQMFALIYRIIKIVSTLTISNDNWKWNRHFPHFTTNATTQNTKIYSMASLCIVCQHNQTARIKIYIYKRVEIIIYFEYHCSLEQWAAKEANVSYSIE